MSSNSNRVHNNRFQYNLCVYAMSNIEIKINERKKTKPKSILNEKLFLKKKLVTFDFRMVFLLFPPFQFFVFFLYLLFLNIEWSPSSSSSSSLLSIHHYHVHTHRVKVIKKNVTSSNNNDFNVLSAIALFFVKRDAHSYNTRNVKFQQIPSIRWK